MKSEPRNLLNLSGFTLVELLIAMVVAFLVSAAIYASYRVQQQNYLAQQQVTQIQQNLRAAMDMISRDFRIAGYDPSYTGNYGVIAGNPTSFSFTGDLCEEEDSPNNPNGSGVACTASSPYVGSNLDETYLYQHYDSNVPPDGVNDAIRRTPAGASIAENIEKLDFVYILETGAQLSNLSATTIDELTAVKVSILARADEPDFKYTDNNTYEYGTGMTWDPATFPASDCENNNCLNYRRRVLVSIIDLRNIGIN